MSIPFRARAISLSLSFVLLAPAAIAATSPRSMFVRDSAVISASMLKEAAFTMPLPDGWKFAFWGEGGKDICREFFGPESPDRLADICWNPKPWDDVQARIRQVIRFTSETGAVIRSLRTAGGRAYQRLVVAPGRRPFLIFPGEDFFLTATPYNKDVENKLIAQFDHLVWRKVAEDETRDSARFLEDREICTSVRGIADYDTWYREHSFEVIERYLADLGGEGLDIETACAYRPSETFGYILASHSDSSDARYWRRVSGLIKKSQKQAFLDQRLSYVISGSGADEVTRFKEIKRLQELGAVPVNSLGQPSGDALGLLLRLGKRGSPDQLGTSVHLVLRFIARMAVRGRAPSDWFGFFYDLLNQPTSTAESQLSEEMQMTVLRRLRERFGQLYLRDESVHRMPSPVQRAIRTNKRAIVCLVLEMAPYESDDANDRDALAEAQRLKCSDSPQG